MQKAKLLFRIRCFRDLGVNSFLIADLGLQLSLCRSPLRQFFKAVEDDVDFIQV
jgi:hypothetical protein